MPRPAPWWSRSRRVVAGLTDTVACWARMPPGPASPSRRFVVIQICGCSYEVLREAVARGRMPALAKLLDEGALELHRIPVGLPTSTPAFQAGLMYGGPVDIPGFEFLEKRTGTYRWFPRPWDAAAVEAAHARPGQGIVRGGRTYGCVFGGGADDTVLTFSHVLRPHAFWGRVGFRALVVPFLILAWLVVKMSAVTLWELARWLGETLRSFTLGRRVAVAPRGGDADPDRGLAPGALHSGCDGGRVRRGAGALRELRGLRRGRPRAGTAASRRLASAPRRRSEHRAHQPRRPPGPGPRLRSLHPVRPRADPLGAVPRGGGHGLRGQCGPRLLRPRRGRGGGAGRAPDVSVGRSPGTPIRRCRSGRSCERDSEALRSSSAR